MTAADVTALTGTVDPAVIVTGIVALGTVVLGPRVARWGIAQIVRMVRG